MTQFTSFKLFEKDVLSSVYTSLPNKGSLKLQQCRKVGFKFCLENKQNNITLTNPYSEYPLIADFI